MEIWKNLFGCLLGAVMLPKACCETVSVCLLHLLALSHIISGADLHSQSLISKEQEASIHAFSGCEFEEEQLILCILLTFSLPLDLLICVALQKKPRNSTHLKVI